MTELERLEQLACDSGVTVDYIRFQSDRLRGLYADGNIALNTKMETTAERVSVMAEELGHHFTSSGNILDQTNVNNRKQERRAREDGFERVVGAAGIIAAYDAHCRNIYEAAEFLGVTESFLREGLNRYRERYGTRPIKYGNCLLYVNPTVTVIRIAPSAPKISGYIIDMDPSQKRLEEQRKIVAAYIGRIAARQKDIKKKLAKAEKRAREMADSGVDMFARMEDHLLYLNGEL